MRRWAQPVRVIVTLIDGLSLVVQLNHEIFTFVIRLSEIWAQTHSRIKVALSHSKNLPNCPILGHHKVSF